MSEGRWWCVKVYHAKSQTYTTLSRFAVSQEEIESDLEAEYEDENDWVFVSATPEDE